MRNQRRIQVGQVIEPREWTNVRSERVHVPDPLGLTHVQFRRFAGCPVCHLHLHSFVQRFEDIWTASIREVVIFHSTTEDLLPHTQGLPFAIIPDPEKQIYAEFGVESSPRSLLSPRGWPAIVRGVLRSAQATLKGTQTLPPLNPQGGRYGLPADFLIAPNGRIIACHYGTHVYDQWSVDDLLRLAKEP